MIKHHFKIAWRSLWNTKSYTFINIVGLSAGLASFIIVLLYLNYELSYDTWSPELENVYRVGMENEGDVQNQTPAPLASFLAEKYPKIEAATSMQGAGEYEVLISADGKSIYHKGFASADSLFLKVFPYQLIQGDKSTALNAPNSVILSEELATTLFGDTNPMGQTVKVFDALEGVVTGIVKLPKTPSHRPVHLIMRDPYEEQNFFWNNHSYETYIKVNQDMASAQLEEDLNRIYFEERIKKDEKLNEAYLETGDRFTLFTDAVPDIQNFSKHGTSNIKTLSILFILAVLLLLAGAINFSNLNVAKSIGRAKEVGVRKVLGSGKRSLIFQFMAETALQCVISFMIAAVLILLFLPYVNNTLNLQLNFWQQNSWELLGQIGICIMVIILLSGIYPSFYLSRFNIISVLKDNFSGGNKRTGLRNVLLVFQFVVTAFFIVTILGVNKQLDFMQHADKGFSGDQILRIESTQATREQGFQKAREELLAIPGVRNVVKTTTVPGDKIADSSTYNFQFQGEKVRMGSVKVSSEYFEALEVPLINGRYFNDSYADQNTRSAIINETAARKLGVENPLGKTISFGGCDEGDVNIVGVVKDINVHGFESAIKPMVYTIENKACMYQSGGAILLKLKSDKVQATVAAISTKWKSIEPKFPIRYTFLDSNFQELFISYFRLQKILNFFGIVAILISVMGLFALTAFTIKQRDKEIGIRKVLGATVSSIVALITKDFIMLLMLAILIAIPLGWYAMDKWLENFAYKTQLSLWIFIVAAVFIFGIAVLTVSMKTIRTAMKNPVKSLRTE